MPPDATTLAHEGVVIEPTLLVEHGEAHFDRVENELRAGAWPSRMVADNLADISAQVAANELAVARMRELITQSGLPFLRASNEKLRASACRAAQQALHLLPAVIAPLEERLDDGTVLRVRAGMKPIATVPHSLRTIDVATGEAATAHHQRSDVCAVPAAGVVAEAMVAIVLAEAVLEKFGGDSVAETRRNLEGYLAAIPENLQTAGGSDTAIG
jgi:N-methylhydantoinase B/oxoprolinase/acetone carboxylase alpha subunit